MQFHFLQAADIHLDRSLNGLRSSERSELQLAPRLAMAKLVDEAIWRRWAPASFLPSLGGRSAGPEG